MRLVGSIHINHPGERERENGAQSRVYLSVDRGLRSGKLDEIDLSEVQILDLIADGAKILRTLRAR